MSGKNFDFLLCFVLFLFIFFNYGQKGNFLLYPPKHTHKLIATQANSTTPLLCRHTLAGLISCRLTPQRLLSLVLSSACITSLVNFCHLQYHNYVLHSPTGQRLILLLELSMYLSSTYSTHTNRCPFSHSIPWLSSLWSCIFMSSPVADYQCLLHCQNFPSLSLVSLRDSSNKAYMHSNIHTHTYISMMMIVFLL